MARTRQSFMKPPFSTDNNNSVVLRQYLVTLSSLKQHNMKKRRVRYIPLNNINVQCQWSVQALLLPVTTNVSLPLTRH